MSGRNGQCAALARRRADEGFGTGQHRTGSIPPADAARADLLAMAARATDLSPLPERLAQNRYGWRDDRGIAEALRGWRRWCEDWLAVAAIIARDDPALAVRVRRGALDASAALCAWPLAEAQRRILRRRQPAGPRLTTAELLARYGDRLRPAGAGRWRTCCPWHQDARPSLVVYSDGHCHCYACGAHRPVADLAAAWMGAAA
jgi:hypothetical protein